MGLKSKLNEKIGNYCFVNKLGSKITLTFPPPRYCNNDAQAVEFTKRGKLGAPSKISDVGDDYLEVKYFGGSGGGWGGVNSDSFPLSSVNIREMS